MGMQEKRNPLKLVLAAAATGAALLVPAMPASAAPTGVIPPDAPCGFSYPSTQHAWFHNCEDHSVRIAQVYGSDLIIHFCVHPGVTVGVYPTPEVPNYKESDYC